MSELRKSERTVIISAAQKMGFSFSQDQIHFFDMYLETLWKWNKKTNLIGLDTNERVVTELLLDSVIASTLLPETGRLLDAGSGSGFPGIPLKICKPRLDVTLIESNNKKVNFLKQVIRVCGLSGIHVVRGRLEQSRNLLDHEGYHAVTARAVGPLPKVLEWCSPYLMSDGLMVLFQGSGGAHILEEHSALFEAHDLQLYKSIPYILPGKATKRYLLFFKKN